MRSILLCVFLFASTATGAYAVFTKSPKKMILGWLGLGLFQSAFFLLVGFEFLAVLNALFTVGSATILQLYSALFGTLPTAQAERVITRQTWIQGVGAVLTLAAILAFAFSEVPVIDKLGDDLDTPHFTAHLLEHFPEFPWILGVGLFLVIVAAATIGRPAWKKLRGGRP